MLLVHHRRLVGETTLPLVHGTLRTLRAVGKLKDPTQQQRKDTRFSSLEEEDKHEHCIGILVHKDIMNTAMGCCPVSSRLITICLRAVPFNITIVQAYAQTSDYDGNEREETTSYRMPLVRHRRRTFLLCKETGMQKWARMLVETGKAFVYPSAMMI